MEIEGKDFLDWLHEVRRKHEEERVRRGLSGKEWLQEVREKAEQILGHKILTVKPVEEVLKQHK